MDSNQPMIKPLAIKVTRKCYHNIDLSPYLKLVDYEKSIRINQRSSPFKPVLIRYPVCQLLSFQKFYRIWVCINRPTPYNIQDQRKLNGQRALDDQTEKQIKKVIIESYQNDQIISYLNVSSLAITAWNQIGPKPKKKFKASHEWVSNFMYRNSLSSQIVSSRSSSRTHRKIENHMVEVNQYKTDYSNFVQTHGLDRVVNYDETSFRSLTGQVKTIAPKNCQQQPKMKQCLNGNGFSIGVPITADGQKLKLILVSKGKMDRSLKKYEKYQTDPRCVLTQSPSGWFTHVQMLEVLNVINGHMRGFPSLLIWDQYKAHLTKDVIEQAKNYKIQILKVPKGLTLDLQPLDYKVNGPYKSKMKSHWIGHNYHEDKTNFNLNLCEMILTCYDHLSQDLIIKYFKCLD